MNQNLSEAAMNWDNAKIEIVFSKKVVFSDACSSSIYTAQWVSPAQYLTSVALTMRLASMFRYELAHPDEEVDHEENVESEVNLLGCVLNPGSACLHTIPKSEDWIKNLLKVNMSTKSQIIFIIS